MTKPIFEIKVTGSQSYAITSHLLSLTITDHSGGQSDTLNLVLDDGFQTYAPPQKGDRIAVSLGYADTGLAPMGEFLIDEVELSSPPAQMSIRACGTNFRESFKATRSRSWEHKTLGDIVKQIAGEHGLIGRVSPALASIVYEHEPQAKESDMSFLTRLAKRHDALVKPVGSILAFAAQDSMKKISGNPLPKIVREDKEVSKYCLTLADRLQFGHVNACWEDKELAKKVTETVGDTSKPGKTLQPTYANQALAQEAARAELAELKRNLQQLSLDMPGDPFVVAQSPLILRGFRQRVDGQYILTKVTHRFNASGYQCQIQAHLSQNS